ncbi:MAG TPA: DUF5985 family protein [Candidatus Paceibacterota bacterium]|nr:DUF5985 family protein [Candidatus Paceibacterota bacterium]
MAETVYMLCALTSIACTGLLLRGYLRTRLALLFWSGIAFLAFALANILLFVDLVMVSHYDLAVWRQSLTLCGVMLLLYGLIRTNN